MAIPPEIAETQRTQTFEAAVAFVEDLGHMRKLMASEFPERGDIRRLSAVLRRLLIDNNGDLRKIAPCRIGPIELQAEDTKPYVKTGANYYMNCRGLIIASWPDGDPRTWPAWTQSDGKAKPFPKILLSMDGFVGQYVLCFKGLWIRRGSLIKHIANKASGVHSQMMLTREDAVIEEARNSLVRKLVDGKHTISLNRSTFGTGFPPDPPKYDPESLDPVHLALVGTAELMLASDSLLELERAIRAEIGALRRA
ncbi:MAG: hypothetical protein V4527_00815 [Pseudomonadota bacterium]